MVTPSSRIRSFRTCTTNSSIRSSHNFNYLKALIISLTLATVMLTSICSCKGGSTTAAITGGDTIHLKYAERLQIVKYDGYTVAKLSNPWDEGKILHTYILVSNNGQGTAGNRKYDKQELLSLFPTAISGS